MFIIVIICTFLLSLRLLFYKKLNLPKNSSIFLLLQRKTIINEGVRGLFRGWLVSPFQFTSIKYDLSIIAACFSYLGCKGTQICHNLNSFVNPVSINYNNCSQTNFSSFIRVTCSCSLRTVGLVLISSWQCRCGNTCAVCWA